VTHAERAGDVGERLVVVRSARPSSFPPASVQCRRFLGKTHRPGKPKMPAWQEEEHDKPCSLEG
jgi:hypothetical protein